MNKLMGLAVLSMSSFAIVGCNNFDGRGKMNVYSDFKIQNHHFSSKSVSYSKGDYRVSLNFDPLQQLVTLSGEGHDRVKFKVSNNHFNFETHEFSASASEMGEDFDIRGTVEADKSVTMSQTYTRSCLIFSIPGHSVQGSQICSAKSPATVSFAKLSLFEPNSDTKIADLDVTGAPNVAPAAEWTCLPCL
jgi:hypothetical protein